MRTYTGWVREIRGEAGGLAAWIACPAQAVPAAGRYLLAADRDAVLGTPLFLSKRMEDGFLAAPPLPSSWAPGEQLSLRGPLGKGFSLPAGLGRLALTALGDTLSRLLPLIEIAAESDISAAVFTDAPLPSLPSALEASPLSALPEALAWADFLALDIPLERLPDLRSYLELSPGQPLLCPGQALVVSAMPCGGIADCGVCAAPAGRGWVLVCKDGPVVDLNSLLEG